MDPSQRAFDLRHRSDEDRIEGRADAALEAATEAASLYRSMPERVLDLANALRLKALALDALDRPAEAATDWTEARGLYAALSISDGVAECDTRLAR